MGFTLVKTLRSHTAYFQFLQEVPGFGNSPIGYIPREKSIPSPYAYSPTDFVYVWNGLRVIIRETAQRKYQAFEIPADIRVYNQEEDAIQAHVMKPVTLAEIRFLESEVMQDVKI